MTVRKLIVKRKRMKLMFRCNKNKVNNSYLHKNSNSPILNRPKNKHNNNKPGKMKKRMKKKFLELITQHFTQICQ
jgi:hypothetical protein